MPGDKDLPPILLVEDDPVDIALFRRGLRILRPRTDLTVARDGDEAVEMLSERWTRDPRGDGVPFSHVVLDLKLPRRSGLEVLEWIRFRPELRDVRVIMLTSSALPPDVERARRVGLDRYFVKPPDFSGLLDVVREILREWVLLP